jgi:uncharacterized caspase-like protein
LRLRFDGQSDLGQHAILYIVAAGVDAYTHCPANNLRYAGADARLFCETLWRQSQTLHRDVECTLLANGGDAEPTRANIVDALLLFKKAKETDTSVLFLAGHGYLNPDAREDYMFLPQDTAAKGGYFEPSTAVKWHEFQGALKNTTGRRLMFVDTVMAAAPTANPSFRKRITRKSSFSPAPMAPPWRRSWIHSATAPSPSR